LVTKVGIEDGIRSLMVLVNLIYKSVRTFEVKPLVKSETNFFSKTWGTLGFMIYEGSQ